MIKILLGFSYPSAAIYRMHSIIISTHESKGVLGSNSMGLLLGMLNLRQKSSHHESDSSRYTFYKIVDANEATGKYFVQCVNTKVILHLNIDEIVFDLDILHGLHPAQACYIGLEYIHLKYRNIADQATNTSYRNRKATQTLSKAQVTHTQSRYSIRYIDRSSNVAFIDNETRENSIMNPIDISLSEELISHFISAEAFQIGILAGTKINEPVLRNRIRFQQSQKRKNSHLRLVK